MAKIVLTMNGAVLRELMLSKGRTTIGRAPHNDFVIESPAVSAEHATISFVGNDAILEDLNSTNGTQVNGQPIKRHFLQENDVIELAQYRIKYIAGLNLACHFDGKNVNGCAAGVRSINIPAIRVLSGINAGKETPLTKALTTIGRLGGQVAVITHRSDGFYLSQVEGEDDLFVNGSLIATSEYRLHQGDVIDLVGAQIEFVSN